MLISCISPPHLRSLNAPADAQTCPHKHPRFDTNPRGELLSSPAITSCHWTSLMYLSGCVSERADWLNAGLRRFTTSKACQSAPGAPETSPCQWGIISEGWHWIRDTGDEGGGRYQPCRCLTPPPNGENKVGKDVRWWGYWRQNAEQVSSIWPASIL